MYKLFSIEKNFTDANNYCTSNGGELAIITNGTEFQDALKAVGVATYVWIGLTDQDHEGIWKYVNGRQSRWINIPWATNEPSNGSDKEHCAQIRHQELNDVFVFFF